MKKLKRLLLGCFCILLFVLAGCGNDYVFTFFYKLDIYEYYKGSSIELPITIKNESGTTYKYTGASSLFTPTIQLYLDDHKGTYEIPIKYPPMTTDIGTHEVKNGEYLTRVFYFDIPFDAPVGEYNLKISYLGCETVYENVLRIIE